MTGARWTIGRRDQATRVCGHSSVRVFHIGISSTASGSPLWNGIRFALINAVHDRRPVNRSGTIIERPVAGNSEVWIAAALQQLANVCESTWLLSEMGALRRMRGPEPGSERGCERTQQELQTEMGRAG